MLFSIAEFALQEILRKARTTGLGEAQREAHPTTTGRYLRIATTGVELSSNWRRQLLLEALLHKSGEGFTA